MKAFAELSNEGSTVTTAVEGGKIWRPRDSIAGTQSTPRGSRASSKIISQEEKEGGGDCSRRDKRQCLV